MLTSHFKTHYREINNSECFLDYWNLEVKPALRSCNSFAKPKAVLKVTIRFIVMFSNLWLWCLNKYQWQMFLFFPQTWLTFGLRIVFIRNPSHLLLWMHCFTVFSLPVLPLGSPLTFHSLSPFLCRWPAFWGRLLFIYFHTHTPFSEGLVFWYFMIMYFGGRLYFCSPHWH